MASLAASSRADRLWVPAALGITALALAIRWQGVATRALVYDETFSVLLAGQPLARVGALVAANDPHPPLYYYLLHLWMAVFGRSDFAVRGLSVLLGSATILLTFLFIRRWAGAAAALLGAGLLAVAPAHVAASQEARMYVLMVMASTLSWAALAAALERGGRWRWVGYTLSTAVMLLSHYFGFLVLLAQAILVAWPGTANAQGRRAWVYAGCAALALLVPWIPAMADQLTSGRAWPAYRPPLSWAAVPQTLAGFAAGGPIIPALGLGGWSLGPMTDPILSASAVAAALVTAGWMIASPDYTRRTKVSWSLAALAPVLLAFVVSLRLHIYSARYLIFVLPPLAALLGAGWPAALRSRRRWRAWASAATLAAVFGANLAGLAGFTRLARLDDFDWRAVSGVLADGARSEDVFLFLPGFARIPVNYYYPGPQRRLALIPNGKDVIGEGGAGADALVGELQRTSRLWVVTIRPVPPAFAPLLSRLGDVGFAFHPPQPVNRALLVLGVRGDR